MSKSKTSEIYRIPPQNYIHILDKNTNVTRVEVGPLNYICHDNEEVVLGPEPMLIIPPRHYCVIENPCRKEINKETNQPEIVFNKVGQVILRHGEQEVRLHQLPFALYPGEVVSGKVTPLKILMNDEALRLRCLQDFIDNNGVTKYAGEEWLFEGPGQYIPNVNVEECGKIQVKIIRENQALRLVASQDTIDRNGNTRKAGEEWLVTKPGAYLPGVFEQVVDIVNCVTLTETVACHIRATANFTDQFGNKRRTGDVWLITYKDCETYIPSVNEEKVIDVQITILTSREFCVICDPFNEKTKTNDLGTFKLQQGEKSFFLHPGESLQKGVEQIYILTAEEGVILSANEPFDDLVEVREEVSEESYEVVESEQKQNTKFKKIKRTPGEKWLIRGPMEYIPPVQATVIQKVNAISLDKNEGVYVRDIKTGEVRTEIGPQKYMLNEHEELWEKDIPLPIEKLLQISSYIDEEKEIKRDRTKVVTYRVPYNSAVQIYDYKDKKPRVVFGPELVMLRPDEMFTPLSLSGGKPKQPNQIRALHLTLGPDFFTDIIEVETSDHARLSMKLSYNWRFDVARFSSTEQATALFSVADFVGDACNAMASRVRAAVAACPFDDFHKHSATLIRAAVFGTNEKNELNYKFEFPANGLIITEVDIQAIEPVDKRTRQALQRSVQIAIEITTASQEATAQQEADRQDQEAKGKLERRKIQDQAEAEKIKKTLLELQAQTKAIETSGAAIAEAQSYADANKITYEAGVEEALLLEEAENTRFDIDLDGENKRRESELKHLETKYEIEASFQEKMSEIESNKFKSMIAAIGPETLKTMALSADEIQVRLLQGLGLQSTLIMDGRKPLNLFQTASQMIHRNLNVSSITHPNHNNIAINNNHNNINNNNNNANTIANTNINNNNTLVTSKNTRMISSDRNQDIGNDAIKKTTASTSYKKKSIIKNSSEQFEDESNSEQGDSDGF